MENKNENKISKAAALHYDMEEGGAPKIVASGSGETADKIIETAKANDIPVVTDEALAQVLTKLTIGDEIPSELYNVVAEIFLFIYSMDKDYGDKHGR
jgi:flagellar biosynthesis protein